MIIYAVIVVLGGQIAIMGLTGWLSNRAIDQAIITERNAAAEREAAKRREEEENRAASCQFINTILNAYREDPPAEPSKTYDNIVDAWASLAERCK
jgi:hypothetical protein